MTDKQRSLIGGISVLGIAGLICKLVGVLYRIPLANMIGGQGLGLYQQVMPAYNLLLAITSAGIPVAISRMVSHSFRCDCETSRNARRLSELYVYCSFPFLCMCNECIQRIYAGNASHVAYGD